MSDSKSNPSSPLTSTFYSEVFMSWESVVLINCLWFSFILSFQITIILFHLIIVNRKQQSLAAKEFSGCTHDSVALLIFSSDIIHTCGVSRLLNYIPRLWTKSGTTLTSNVRWSHGDSQRWLQRQRSDPYVKRSKIESYRCRSAFKLIQLHDQIPGGLFVPGDFVVDCGAAPGSWSQVALAQVCPPTRSHRPGLVIGFDLLDYASIPGVISYSGVDLRNWAKCTTLIKQSVQQHTGSSEFETSQNGINVLLSDMAPNATGISDLDSPRIIDLASCVLRLALRVCAPGATLVIKLWQSNEAEQFKDLVSPFFRGPSPVSNSFTKFIKPPASRSDSAEIYLVARGFSMPSTRD